MDLYQLETFLAVAQEKSFSRAAQRLHRTQSAISQTISRLEEELGETLFDRSSRDGTLTDAGHLLVEYSEELLNLRSEAHDALAELRQLHQGKLVIAANEFTVLCLLPVLNEFHRLHPTIKIQVQRTLASQIQRLVVNHNVEFGILSFKPDDEQLSSMVFYRDQLVFVVYPSHPLANAKNVSIRDLGAESFVAHNVVSPYRVKVIEAFKESKTALNMNVELPTLESIKEFVRMGSGLAMVPRITVEDDLRRGDLVEVPINELRLERQMRIVSREGAPMSHAGRAFLKVCESAAAAPNTRYLFQHERKVRRSSTRTAPA
ncbi:MAG TPA: LysR family transcriptional regulator [Terriglobales bacterium]|nr:LysR family transcriptional regulator [Terriglobales bacterium]